MTREVPQNNLSRRIWPAVLVMLSIVAFGAVQVDAQRASLSPVAPAARGEWQVQPPVTTQSLRRVQMLTASNIWAVGENGTILHYDGSAWSPFGVSTTDTLVDMYMITADDGYIVGWSAVGADIFHYDGTAWTLATSSPRSLNRVHASGPDNVWVVGEDTTLHWDGSQWTTVAMPVDRQLFGVQVISDTVAWAVGQFEPVSGRGLILRLDHGQWNQVDSPAPQSIFDLQFVSPSEGWAAGYAGFDSYILRYQGSTWTLAFSNAMQLDRLRMFAPTEGWALSTITGLITHFDGSAFTAVPDPAPFGSYPNSISMLSPDEGWIVGTSGLMMSYNCGPGFTDVSPPDYFYDAVRYLYCREAISGYSDSTFRPYNDTTRAQLSKIVVLALGWPVNTTGGPHFTDLQPDNPFYQFVETAFNRGIISGYADGTFRPGNDVTRAQLSKIVVSAFGWTSDTSGGPHFTDVPLSDPFYPYIETAYHKRVVSGYADGTFRPGASATRGQISKIVDLSVFAR